MGRRPTRDRGYAGLRSRARERSLGTVVGDAAAGRRGRRSRAPRTVAAPAAEAAVGPRARAVGVELNRENALVRRRQDETAGCRPSSRRPCRARATSPSPSWPSALSPQHFIVFCTILAQQWRAPQARSCDDLPVPEIDRRQRVAHVVRRSFRDPSCRRARARRSRSRPSTSPVRPPRARRHGGRPRRGLHLEAVAEVRRAASRRPSCPGGRRSSPVRPRPSCPASLLPKQ